MGRRIRELLHTKGLVTMTEYAEKWKLKATTVYGWVNQCWLPYTRLGNNIGLNPEMEPFAEIRRRSAQEDQVET